MGVLYQCLYFVRTAARGLRASPVISVVAVTTIGITLVLVGVFALLAYNMEDLHDQFGTDLRLTAYLSPDLPDTELDGLASRAAALDGVERVVAITPEQALDRFRASVGDGGALLEGLDENPLPASLEITLEPAAQSAQAVAQLTANMQGWDGVDELSSGRDWVEGYLRAVSMVKGVGIGVGLILSTATLLIIANTIRLGIFSRRDELEILSLVGAGRVFVRMPFLLEGALQGGAGGAIAIAILFALFQLALPGFEFGLELLVGTAPRFFTAWESMVLIAGGAGIGLLGSAAALTGGWRRT
jgi:cell division transport system permease protein